MSQIVDPEWQGGVGGGGLVQGMFLGADSQ